MLEINKVKRASKAASYWVGAGLQKAIFTKRRTDQEKLNQETRVL